MPTPRMVPTSWLQAPSEPLRCEMSDQAMDDLVASIKQLGILEPLLVSPLYQNGSGEYQGTPDPEMGEVGAEPMRYEIIDGHRRFTAATIAGLEELPVMIFEDAAQAKYAIMLHANVCREDVTPFEEGVQFLELATKHDWSMDDLMRFFRKSEDYINDRVDVVRKDQQVAEALRSRSLSLGQAKEILKCQDESFRPYLLEQGAVHGATIGALREMRRHHESDLREAQGQLPIGASEQFVVGAVLPPDECVWCGRTDDPANIVRVPVHQYHQSDLKAALETFGLRAMLKAKE